MNDPYIEDISCNGYQLPVYIWHTVYESMPTQINYEKRRAQQNNHQTRLQNWTTNIHSPTNTRRHTSRGLQGSCYPRQVSKKGDTFTIRKYKSNPFTIVDLLKRNTLDVKMAAYLWTLVEYKRSMMVCRAVASGKTALLNSVGMYIKPEMKVVTIEEVRELRLHENWIPLTSQAQLPTGSQRNHPIRPTKIQPQTETRLHCNRRGQRRGNLHLIPEHGRRTRRPLQYTRRQPRLGHQTTKNQTNEYPRDDASPHEQPSPYT